MAYLYHSHFACPSDVAKCALLHSASGMDIDQCCTWCGEYQFFFFLFLIYMYEDHSINKVNFCLRSWQLETLFTAALFFQGNPWWDLTCPRNKWALACFKISLSTDYSLVNSKFNISLNWIWHWITFKGWYAIKLN